MDEHGEFVAGIITASARPLAAGVVERHLQHQPDVLQRYGTSGFQDLAGDTRVSLLHLAEALATARPALFDAYLAWLKVAQTARGMSPGDLTVNLTCMGDELRASLPAGRADMAVGYLENAIPRLARAPDELPSLLAEDFPHADLARRYVLAVLETRRADAIALVLAAHEGGVSVPDIHRHVIARAQAEIGRMWQMNEIHVAEEHYSTTVASQVLAQLRERMPRADPNGHRVLCTTVSGDLHDLAMQLVADAFEMGGWDTIPLGASTPAVDLVRAIGDFAVDLLALSASAPLQMRATADEVRAVRSHPDCAKLPILVGGESFRAVGDLWQVVGADGTAVDAWAAASAGERLVRSPG